MDVDVALAVRGCMDHQFAGGRLWVGDMLRVRVWRGCRWLILHGGALIFGIWPGGLTENFLSFPVAPRALASFLNLYDRGSYGLG